MITKKIKLTFSLGFALCFACLFGFTAGNASASSLEVGEVRTLGKEIKVPVTLHDVTSLTSGNIQIGLSDGNAGVKLKGFEPNGIFKDRQFRTIPRILENTLTIDLLQIGKEVRLDKDLLIGHITYSLSADFKEGGQVILPITRVVALDRLGADLKLDQLDGKISRKVPIGSVIGKDAPSVADAMRILQHVRGDIIQEQEARLSGDVDGDNVLTQNDAKQILEFISGKRKSFLALRAKELDTAVLKSSYTEKVEAIHGRKPFKFTRKVGSLPAGVTLNAETGELTGIPTRAMNYAFTIQVTDAIGNTADRQFVIDVIDSNIVSVEKILPINVRLNAQPALPTEVSVVYKDKSTGKEKVTWSAVNTSAIGIVTAKGKIGESGFTINIDINIVNTDYINGIDINYVQFLNLHTIKIRTSADVNSIVINKLQMHYEGDNKFSLSSASFTPGQSVILEVKDKYGNILETKQIQLKVSQ